MTLFDLRPPADAKVTAALLGEASYLLGRALDTVAQPHGRQLLALGACGLNTPLELDLKGTAVKVVGVEHVGGDPTEGAWAEPLRRLASEELKQWLVYRKHAAWYRGGAFYGHNLQNHDTGYAWCNGVRVEVVSLPGGRLALAVDRTIARLDLTMNQLTPLQRVRFIEKDPYSGAPQAPPDDDADDPDEEDARVFGSLRARNFVWYDGTRCRRVWADLAATRRLKGAQIVVFTDRDGDRHTVDPAQIRAVLAPQEIGQRGMPSEFRGTHEPPDRIRMARVFIQKFLQDVELLGARGSVSLTPLTDAPLRTERMPWPALMVGEVRDLPDGQAVALQRGEPPAEHRVHALEIWGPRAVPESLRSIAVVPLAGHGADAEALAEKLNARLAAWHMQSVRASVTPFDLPEHGEPEARVAAVEQAIRALAPATRPSALLVMKERDWRPGEAPGELYQLLHESLGHRLGIPTKPIQVRDGLDDSSVIINLTGLLARAGGTPWGLVSSADRQGLIHDLVFAFDVGGRDRSGSQGNEYAGLVALAGDHCPTGRQRHATAVRERMEDPGQLRTWVLELARELRGQRRASGSWLFLRDGRFADDELSALREAAVQARREGLLDGGATLTAAEVHKKHALRIFAEADGKASQPPAGAALWLTAEGATVADLVLATTGAPWNLRASAAPIRCSIRTLGGAPQHAAAAEDIWRLTHLAWTSPRAPLKLPLPLHAAQNLCDDLARGRAPYAFPC